MLSRKLLWSSISCNIHHPRQSPVVIRIVRVVFCSSFRSSGVVSSSYMGRLMRFATSTQGHQSLLQSQCRPCHHLVWSLPEAFWECISLRILLVKFNTMTKDLFDSISLSIFMSACELAIKIPHFTQLLLAQIFMFKKDHGTSVRNKVISNNAARCPAFQSTLTPLPHLHPPSPADLN